VLQPVELVEIFHQFLLLLLCQLNDICVWKLVGIIPDRLVDITGLDPVDAGDLGVEEHLLAADLD
jgi:hypothetical protein